MAARTCAHVRATLSRLSAVTLPTPILTLQCLVRSQKCAYARMFGRSTIPQVASTSQSVPCVQRSFRTCRHQRLSGARAAIATPEPVLEEQKMPSPTEQMPSNLNKYSQRITQPKSQGASQAMLYATGLTEEDMNKPQVHPFFCRNRDTCPVPQLPSQNWCTVCEESLLCVCTMPISPAPTYCPTCAAQLYHCSVAVLAASMYSHFC